jgi:hypothetical protein
LTTRTGPLPLAVTRTRRATMTVAAPAAAARPPPLAVTVTTRSHGRRALAAAAPGRLSGGRRITTVPGPVQAARKKLQTSVPASDGRARAGGGRGRPGLSPRPGTAAGGGVSADFD